MANDPLDRTLLSPREDAILDGAIEGMTDAQIAQRLDISQSTVNSYWVRIRGKLGQQSRTELVARALRAEAHTNLTAMTARAERLQDEADVHARVSHDFAHVEIYRAALDAMPEAVLVCCHEALIRYANPRLEAMFGYDPGELVERPLSILVPHSVREQEGLRVREYMANPTPMRIGVGHVVYGQRRNGTQFRVVLLLDGRPTSNGNVATCLVRDFASEIEFRRGYSAGGAWNSVD